MITLKFEEMENDGGGYFVLNGIKLFTLYKTKNKWNVDSLISKVNLPNDVRYTYDQRHIAVQKIIVWTEEWLQQKITLIDE